MQFNRGIHIRKSGTGLAGASWKLFKEIDGFIFSFSPDGKQLAVSDNDIDYVEFWDTSTWEIVRTINFGGGFEAADIKYSPDGKTLSVGGKGAVKVFDVQTGKLKANLVSGPRGHWLKYTAQGTFWHSGNKRMIAAELLTK